ncbi:MAG: hypothetical protein QNJ33_03330 [Crocosphaera sp.]|nr:hypothetical protein [Crocosphaera sp.]
MSRIAINDLELNNSLLEQVSDSELDDILGLGKIAINLLGVEILSISWE